MPNAPRPHEWTAGERGLLQGVLGDLLSLEADYLDEDDPRVWSEIVDARRTVEDLLSLKVEQ